MIYEVFMPALSSTMTEGKITSWVKAPGDKVEKGETVLVVESDKADMDVESFYEGYLAIILTEAGQSAPVGDAIALIAETEAEIATAQQQGGGKSPAASGGDERGSGRLEPAAASGGGDERGSGRLEPAAIATKERGSGRIVASPRAKKLAKDLKVDLNAIAGSGPHGRIVAEDVQAAAGSAPKAPPKPAFAAALAAPVAPAAAIATMAAATAAPRTAAPPNVVGQQVPLTTLQNAVVKNMMVSLDVPTFHVAYTITTDGLDALYKQVKSKGVTMTALLAKAVAMTLTRHPLLNACFTNGAINHPGDINVAVAVAMDDGGLITPVLRGADKQDLYSLSRSWKDLVDRARGKQLQPDEYSTGTFAISNLGMFGVSSFDAILPPGMGAILAVSASKPTVVATKDGMLGVKSQMQVNITCDHRVIYGAHAAAFLKDLAKLIETEPQALTL
jgi:pyruvate dehydrogenase E2 component (dihydrolipoamide acetyltransferase)